MWFAVNKSLNVNKTNYIIFGKCKYDKDITITRTNLLSCLQHGFVHGRSCTTQLFEVFDKWTEAIEQGDSVDAIYHDFVKAFDMVPYQRLLVKLAG